MSVPLNTHQWGLKSGFGIEHSVPIDKIDFSQQHLDEDKVAAMANKDPATMPSPIAAKVGGRYIVQDGHHRVAAAIQRGRKTVTLKVF